MINKLKRIINSRLREKSEYENEEYYKERLKICSSCEYASAKVDDKSLFDRFLSWMYGFKNFCTKCKCPVNLKISEELEECPLGKWKQVEVKN